jgi:hypothetical protein
MGKNTGYYQDYYQRRKANEGSPLGRSNKLDDQTNQQVKNFEDENRAIRQKAVDEARKEFDSIAKKLERKIATAESQKLRVNTQAQAADYNNLVNKEIPELKAKLADAEDKLNVAERLLASNFKADKPMSIGEMNKALSAEEEKIAAKNLRLDFDKQTTAEMGYGDYRTERWDDLYKADKSRYQEAKKVAPDISVEEYKAINKYTAEGYVYMNGAPRGLQEDPNSQRAFEQRVEARMLQRALDKLPNWEGDVIRNTRVPQNQFDKDYQVGKVVRLDGFTSTSSDLSASATANYGSQSKAAAIGKSKNQKIEADKASRYDELATREKIKALPTAASQQVVYKMRVKSGKKIDKFSVAPKESEVLLKHGWRGEIKKIETRADGVKVVYLEEV